MALPCRLADLHPSLVGSVSEGKIYFDCPFPGCEHMVSVMISAQPFHERPSQHDGQRPVKYWQASGSFPESLTLSPSIDLVEVNEKGQKIRTLCWHGHIKDGNVT